MKKALPTESTTWIEIDARALVSNLRSFKKFLPKKTELMCVVKANAYGHGLEQVMSILKDTPQVNWFSVFSFEDALRLRVYTDKKILVLCNTGSSHWGIAVKKNISVTISSLSELLELTTYKHKKKLKWHLKVDTGLGRQGFLAEDMPIILKLLSKHALKPEGLYSHFSGVEEKQFDSYSFKQCKVLVSWKEALEKMNIHPKIHISGTAGVLRHDVFGLDIVRIGIGLYGLYPSEDVEKHINQKDFLKPVLSFKTFVSESKTLPKGSSIAYDRTHILTRDSKIAILPIGYWDGIPRTLSSKGVVLVRGKRAPILGRVMMNMCVVDVTGIPGVKTGDIITCIGKDRGEEISVETFAKLAGTINYEVVTRLNPLIERRITGLQKKAKYGINNPCHKIDS